MSNEKLEMVYTYINVSYERKKDTVHYSETPLQWLIICSFTNLLKWSNTTCLPYDRTPQTPPSIYCTVVRKAISIVRIAYKT